MSWGKHSDFNYLWKMLSDRKMSLDAWPGLSEESGCAWNFPMGLGDSWPLLFHWGKSGTRWDGSLGKEARNWGYLINYITQLHVTTHIHLPFSTSESSLKLSLNVLIHLMEYSVIMLNSGIIWSRCTGDTGTWKDAHDVLKSKINTLMISFVFKEIVHSVCTVVYSLSRCKKFQKAYTQKAVFVCVYILHITFWHLFKLPNTL